MHISFLLTSSKKPLKKKTIILRNYTADTGYNIYCTMVLLYYTVVHSRFLPHAVNCGRFCFWSRQSATARSKLRKVPFLALSDFFHFLVCASNTSGTAELICAKLTAKTRLVLRSDQFECQGQRSKVKVTREKFPHYWKCIVTRSLQITSCMQQTGPFHRCRGWQKCIAAVCMRFTFGRTSLL